MIANYTLNSPVPGLSSNQGASAQQPVKNLHLQGNLSLATAADSAPGAAPAYVYVLNPTLGDSLDAYEVTSSHLPTPQGLRANSASPLRSTFGVQPAGTATRPTRSLADNRQSMRLKAALTAGLVCGFGGGVALSGLVLPRFGVGGNLLAGVVGSVVGMLGVKAASKVISRTGATASPAAGELALPV
jgi:hypothetical protein